MVAQLDYPTFEALDFVLDLLGPDYMTALAVLNGEGITGVHTAPCSCPIARFLSAHLPGLFQVGYHVIFWDLGEESITHSVPKSVRFVAKLFDEGALPSLCALGVNCPFRCYERRDN